MKAKELTAIIPKIRVIDSDTGQVFEGYYCEMPETTYCCLPHPPVKTVRMILTFAMTDWGLPNNLKLYRIDDDDEVRIFNSKLPKEET